MRRSKLDAFRFEDTINRSHSRRQMTIFQSCWCMHDIFLHSIAVPAILSFPHKTQLWKVFKTLILSYWNRAREQNEIKFWIFMAQFLLEKILKTFSIRDCDVCVLHSLWQFSSSFVFLVFELKSQFSRNFYKYTFYCIISAQPS